MNAELNVNNVIYLNASAGVGGLDVIHMSTALFAYLSSLSPTYSLCLLGLFKLLPPRSNLPIHSFSVHIIVSLFCSLIPFPCLLPHLFVHRLSVSN